MGWGCLARVVFKMDLYLGLPPNLENESQQTFGDLRPAMRGLGPEPVIISFKNPPSAERREYLIS